MVRTLAERRELPDATAAALDRMTALPADGAWRDVVLADLDYHRGLVAAGGNERLAKAHSDLLAEIALCIVQTGWSYESVDEVVHEHAGWPTPSASAMRTPPSASSTGTSPRDSAACASEEADEPRAPERFVLLAAVLFGTTGTAQALGPDGTSPLTVGAARIAVGAAASWRSRSPRARCSTAAAGHPARHRRGGRRRGYQLCFFAAVDSTGVALGTVVALGSGPRSPARSAG